MFLFQIKLTCAFSIKLFVHLIDYIHYHHYTFTKVYCSFLFSSFVDYKILLIKLTQNLIKK